MEIVCTCICLWESCKWKVA